ncbi:hypothetical protein AB0J27_05965 [Micromonospora chokoriensis]
MTHDKNRIDKLLEVVGAAAQLQGATSSHAWEKIESSLRGVRLPDDYKWLVDNLPDGRFLDYLRIIRPGDFDEPTDNYLGYYAYRLEDMRNDRKLEPARFPYPIYPEPSGILPWGEGSGGELFFWLLESADPDDWRIICTDASWTRWNSYPGPLSAFLLNLVEGRVDDLPFTLPINGPAFVPAGSGVEAAVLPQELFWDSMRQGEGVPQARLPELLSAVAVPSSVSGRAAAGEESAAGLPSDYVEFVSHYGHGRIFDVDILVSHGCAEHSIVAVAESLRFAIQQRGRTEFDPPVLPEPGGMIPWGRTRDGWYLGWAPTDPDPDRWGVAVISPDGGNVAYYEAESFSSFLCKYSGIDERQIVLLGRKSWRGTPRLRGCAGDD